LAHVAFTFLSRSGPRSDSTWELRIAAAGEPVVAVHSNPNTRTLQGETSAAAMPELLDPGRLRAGWASMPMHGLLHHMTMLDEKRSTSPIRLIQNWQPPGN